MEIYHFQASPINFGPNPYPDPPSPLYGIVRIWGYLINVGFCTATQHGDLVLYALWYPQPMKADERKSDVIGTLQMEDQPYRPSVQF